MKYSSIILQLVLVALWKEALASPAPNPEGRILTPPPPGSIIPPPTDPQPSQTPSPPPTPSPPATSVPTPTGSTLPGAPIPTSISSPVNSDVRKSSLNIQKNLTTSMNDQGTKLTVQVTSSSSELGFRGDFNLQYVRHF
ncbi:hypothetical protein BKA69DRAFT_1073419 [Paraphysoderma sedebokerense]|nr:hypothetical protein BKA69DRAFT_1073419 [Paraphysoderma sedebokerense]